jgi:hypothetical protein
VEPIQLWMPMFCVNAEDATWIDEFYERSEWDKVETVWLLPKEMAGLSGEVWWHVGDGPLKHVAIPWESFDRIDVFHIGSNGVVFGRNANRYFPSIRFEMKKVFEQWRVNVPPHPYDGLRTIDVEVPVLRSNAVGEIERPRIEKVTLKPSVEAASGLAKLMLGGNTSGDGSAHSASIIGRYVCPQFPDSIPIRHIPEAEIETEAIDLRSLFPFGISHAANQELSEMVSVAGLSQHDSLIAEARAVQALSRFGLKCRSTIEYAVLMPLVQESALDGFDKAAGDLFKLRVDTIKKMKGDLDIPFRKEVKEKIDIALETAERAIEVDRVWGPIGLMWLTLATRLASGNKYRRCKRIGCGNVVEGKATKKYCGEDTCEDKRKAARARKYREKKKRTEG